VPDHDQRRVLVVVDPGTATKDSMKTLEADLRAVAPGINPQVRSGCHPRGPLDAAVKRLLAGGLGLKGPYGFTISPATGTVEVHADSPSDAATIKQVLGDTVTILPGRPGPFQGSRQSDSSPHYGDAAINWQVTNSQWVICSSNFSYVSNYYGTQVTATAGHCGGGVWTSGGYTVGANVDSTYPGPDVELLYTAGESHTNQIYSDPGAPTTRTVIDQHDLGLNEYACAGGERTLAQCGAFVASTSYYECYTGVCQNFIQLFRPSAQGDPMCNHGDSGGVVYQRSGSSGAIANGMINAGTVDDNGDPLYGFGGYDCWTTPISTIESALNISLKTTA
jgi:hypothetical protein